MAAKNVLLFLCLAIGLADVSCRKLKSLQREFERLEMMVLQEALKSRQEFATIAASLDELRELVDGNRTIETVATDIPNDNGDDTGIGNTEETLLRILQGFGDEKRQFGKTLSKFESMFRQISLNMSALRNEMSRELSAIERKFSSKLEEITFQQEEDLRSFKNEQLSKDSEFKTLVKDEVKQEIASLQEALQLRVSLLQETAISDLKHQLLNNFHSNLSDSLDGMYRKVQDNSMRHCGDWRMFENSCYFFSDETLSWADARLKCMEMSAILVEVDTADENDFVKKYSKITDNNHYGPWLGASDLDVEGQWRWHGSEKLLSDGFTDWHPLEPNGETRENCLHLYRHNNNWNDLMCTRLTRFVCEK